MPSRKHLVAIAIVLTVVVLTLTAWHKRGNNTTDAQPGSPATTSSSPTVPTSSAVSQTPTPSPSRSTPARTATPAPAAPKLTVAQLSANLAGLFGSGDSYSVAGYDLRTGQSVTAGATSGMTEASLVKLDILQTALYRSQQGINDFDEDDAEAMMEQSDNDAGDQVFDSDDGNAGLQQYNAAVGLTTTQLDPTGTWGLSTTAAADQLTLLKQLVASKSALTPASRAYALSLMGNVEADQQWGVSAAADSGAATQLKDGWLNIDSDDGLWAVNSAGLTTVGGHPVLLVVLSQHQPDMQTGVDRVQTAAQQLATALRTS